MLSMFQCMCTCAYRDLSWLHGEQLRVAIPLLWWLTAFDMRLLQVCAVPVDALRGSPHARRYPHKRRHRERFHSLHMCMCVYSCRVCSWRHPYAQSMLKTAVLMLSHCAHPPNTLITVLFLLLGLRVLLRHKDSHSDFLMIYQSLNLFVCSFSLSQP